MDIEPGWELGWTWRVIDDFSSGSVCMVFASEKYDDNDYIHSYVDFMHYRNRV